ncbi:MAG: hypothetical protein JNJ83_24685 [Verrucomicrobiaceae bacterium]|nr:hypothetical protein [Verrucomicrobiaceae bacterium]
MKTMHFIWRTLLLCGCYSWLPGAEPPPAPSPTRTELWIPTESFSEVLNKHPNAVMLSAAEYEALVRDAGKLTADQLRAANPIEGLVIESMKFKASFTGSETELGITGEVVVKCLGELWSSAEMPLPFDHLVRASVDNTSTLVPPAKDMEHRRLVVKGKGKHVVKLEFREPIHFDAARSEKSVQLRMVPNLCVLELQSNQPVIGEGVHASSDGAVSTWTLSRPNRDSARLIWRDKALELADWVAAETRIQEDSVVTFHTVQASSPDNQLTFSISPGNATVGDVACNSLRNWKQDGSKLLVELRPGVTKSSLVVELRLSHSAASAGGKDKTQVSIPHLSGPLLSNSEGQSNILTEAEDLAFLGVTGSAQLQGSTVRWRLNEPPPELVLKRIEPQVIIEADALATLNRDDLSIDRTLVVMTDRPISELELTLPNAEEFANTTGNWKRTGATLRYEWPQGLTPGLREKIVLRSSKRLVKDQPITIENIAIPSAAKVAGYVGLSFDPMWRVSVAQTLGLEERDARAAPVKGKMAWFGLREFKVQLQASRRAAIFDAEVAAYALPRARTVEIEGQVTLNVSDAPLRDLIVKFPPTEAKFVRWTSPLVGEQKLNEQTGEWAISLRKEMLGNLTIRFRLSQPASVAGAEGTTKLSASLPTLALPQARRFHGTWVVEANTDTELAFTPKAMQPVDVLKAPMVEGYSLRHRAVAAFEYGTADAALKVDAVRHSHSELASMVVTGLKLRSVIGSDGSVTHEAMLGVKHSGEQFLHITLPKDASLLSVFVNQQPIKPVRGPDGSLSLPLPPRSTERTSVPIRLIYDQRESPWSSKGRQKLVPPQLGSEIPIMGTDWQVYAPAGYEMVKTRGTLDVISDDENWVSQQISMAAEGRDSEMPAIWASQPGAIRTYSANGSFLPGGKMYGQPTSSTMQHDNAGADGVRSRMLNQVGRSWESPAAIAAVSGAPVARSNVYDAVNDADQEARLGKFESAADIYQQALAANELPANTIAEVQSRLHDARQASLLQRSMMGLPDTEKLTNHIAALKKKLTLNPADEAARRSLDDFNRSLENAARADNDKVHELKALQTRLAEAKPVEGFSAPINPASRSNRIALSSTSNALVGAQPPGATPPAKTGLLSVDLELPTSGQRLRLVGGQSAGDLELEYVSWERLLVAACGWMTLGGLAFIVFGRRRWFLLSSFVAVVAFAGISLVRTEWDTMGYSFAIGWLVALAGWMVIRAAKWLEEPVTAASLSSSGVLLLIGSFTIPSYGAEPMRLLPDPAAHEVFVPYEASKVENQPQHYYLERSVFEKLWSLAKENRKPTPRADDPNAPVTQIVSALHRIHFSNEGLRVDSVLDVVTAKKWSALELKCSLSDTQLKPVKVVIDGNDGALVLENPGVHKVEITWETGLQKSAHEIALQLPASTTALAQLTLTETDGIPHLPQGIQSSIEDRNVALLVPKDGLLTFTRTPRRPLENILPPPTANVEVSTTFQSPGSSQTVWKATYRFPGVAKKELGVLIDPEWRIAEIKEGGPFIGTEWREMDGKRALFFHLASEANDVASLALQLEPLSVNALTRMPHLEPVAAKWDGEGKLGWAEGLEVSTSGIDDSQRTGATSLSLAWRLKKDGPVGVNVVRADPKAGVAIDYVFQVSEQKLELAAAIVLSRRLGNWERVRVTMPDGMELQGVQCPSLLRHVQDGNDIHLHFANSQTNEQRIVLHFAKTVSQPVTKWDLRPVKVHGVTRTRSQVIIAAHAALDVRLGDVLASAGAREIDPATLSQIFTIVAPLEKKRAIQMETSEWTLPISLNELPTRFSADGVMLVRATMGALALSQQVFISVEQGALKKAVITLPASLPEASVMGELLREVQTKVNGDMREYECSFQTQGGLLGWTTLTFDTQLPLTDAEISVPMVQIEGIDRLRRFFVLDNASAREQRVVSLNGVDVCDPSLLPYLPEVTTKPMYYQGRLGAGNGEALRVAYSQLQATEGNAAVVTLAEIRTLLRPDGERWDTVQYSVFNRSLQFLPVVLDPSAELIAVSVGGEPVRADQELRQGRKARLIPLIQTEPGQRSIEVRLIYRIRGKDLLANPIRLDDPEVDGISAERTIWSVSVPAGMKLSDQMAEMYGNMEVVPEEGREVAETESWLSELGRFNRMFASIAGTDSQSRGKLIQQGQELAKTLKDKIDILEQKAASKGNYLSKDGESAKESEKLQAEISKLKSEWMQQNIILDQNRDMQAIPTKKLNVQASNGWLVNNGRVSKEGIGTLQVASNSLNDNLGVQNDFFKLPGTNTYTGTLTVNTGKTITIAGGTMLNFNGGNARSSQASDNRAPNDMSSVGVAGPRAPASVTPAAPAPLESPKAVPSNEFNPRPQNQLRPTGRRSITLEVPLTGTVYHFRKLKDHAALQFDLSKVTSHERQKRAWILGGGLTFLGFIWFVGNRRQKRASDTSGRD